jgi:hypothetical protein
MADLHTAWAEWNDNGWRGERPWPACALPPENYHHEAPSVEMPVVSHETRVIAIGAVVVVVIATVLAFVLFGAFAAFAAISLLPAYIILLTAPFWVPALLDDAEDHAVKMRAKRVGPARG